MDEVNMHRGAVSVLESIAEDRETVLKE